MSEHPHHAVERLSRYASGSETFDDVFGVWAFDALRADIKTVLSALTAERDRMAALLEEARGYLGATQGPFAVALAQQIGHGRGE